MIAGNTGNVVCNTSFTNLSDSRVKTGIAELFDSVEAKQHERPDMNGDLRLGFASDDLPDGDRQIGRRHRDGDPRLLAPHQRALGGVQGPGRGGSLAGPAKAEEQVNMEALRGQRQAPRARALGSRLRRGRTTGCRPTSSTSATRGGRRSTAWWSWTSSPGRLLWSLYRTRTPKRSAGLTSGGGPGAGGGRRELRGHDGPGQQVCHAGPGAAR